MRKRLFVLLAFLLVLYIVPSILAPSSSHAAILAGPNMNKEFSPSTEYEASDQSITSFSETLPDDILFRLDNESYGEYSESFANVADWTGAGAIASDGDLGYWNIPNDLSYPVVYTNSPSFADAQNLYLEVAMDSNYSSIGGRVILYKAAAMGGGTLWQSDYFNIGTSGIVKKWIISNSGPLESLQLRFQSNGNARAYIDYLYISSNNETGWQHDGSETAGITSSSGGSITTNGDWVTLSNTGAGSFKFAFDTTTTEAMINPNYYPFLSLYAGGGTFPSIFTVKMRLSDGSNVTIQSSERELNRYNLMALSGGLYIACFYVEILDYGTNSIAFDWIKLYSIANFTYTGTGTSSDDVLYVEDEVLYCSATSITSIVLDHDPALSLATTTNDLWNVTTGSGTPQSDYYVGAWAGYSSDTSGTFTAGTLTDVRVKFTASANIGAISFLILLPEWHEVGTAIIIFSVALNETALNWLIIFLGLFMIPASTLYLVKGGKDGMSANKFFYFCIAFMLGWGLLLGGIYG